MIDLSPRLRMVASLVPACEFAADVGTDHGYLSAWLLQSGTAQQVFATDINAGPLSRAKQTAQEFELSDKMEFHLCDGLQFPGAERAQAVILAGMGGETMVSILEAAPWSWQTTALILQPQSKQRLLYAWLREHAIPISEAKLCEDAGKRYLAFRAGTEGSIHDSVEDLLLRAHDPLLPDYIESEVMRISRAIAGINAASRDMESEKNDLNLQLEYYQQYQKAVKAW